MQVFLHFSWIVIISDIVTTSVDFTIVRVVALVTSRWTASFLHAVVKVTNMSMFLCVRWHAGAHRYFIIGAISSVFLVIDFHLVV